MCHAILRKQSFPENAAVGKQYHHRFAAKPDRRCAESTSFLARVTYQNRDGKDDEIEGPYIHSFGHEDQIHRVIITNFHKGSMQTQSFITSLPSDGPHHFAKVRRLCPCSLPQA
jgi:hypothetical protein